MQSDKMEELLMELSNKISVMQKDIESIKSEMHSNYIRSDENDDQVRELVEERTRYAANRQDAIKAELQGQIDLLKQSQQLNEKQSELYATQIKTINTEMENLKNEKKNKIYSKWEMISDKIFWIVVAVVFAAVFKYLNFVPPKPF